MSVLNKICVFLFLVVNLFGCTQELAKALNSEGSVNTGGGDEERLGAPPGGNTIPQICSALDFDNVSWPSSYSSDDRQAFALGMNITGSFEGHSGWTNLSNNFDGQGVSMGILNQNLGQGTLQPLLIYMRDHHKSILQKAMTASMLRSLLSMLAKWEKNQKDAKELPFFERVPLFDSERSFVLDIDSNIDKKYGVFGLQPQSTSESVEWAKKTLYINGDGVTFKSSWRKALKQIAGEPAYVSQQIQAAQYIHNRALRYQARLGWKQLRSYLFLFDIVVQNGSLKTKHFEEFEEWVVGQQTRITEEEQMLEMLDIRLQDVNPKWKENVRVRKQAVILGFGFVHGEHRNLPIEYCFDPILPYL